MAEEVIGEHATLEEMGGARMHATVSGCGDNLVPDDEAAIDAARRWLGYLPTSWRGAPPAPPPGAPQRGRHAHAARRPRGAGARRGGGGARGGVTHGKGGGAVWGTRAVFGGQTPCSPRS